MSHQNPVLKGERRVQARYPHQLAIACRLLGKPEGESWPATVEDLSCSGLSLSAAVECRRGAVLVVKVEGMMGRFKRPLLARVANATPGPRGQFTLGCAFVTPLAEDEVQTLLLTGSAD